jgi:hypothetical protein
VLPYAGLPAHRGKPAVRTNREVRGNVGILSGPVANGDLQKVADALSNSSSVNTIVLRNSPGGNIATGYRLGELFRLRGLRTALSGFCYSSCSRMFLGGKTRYFTDDYPAIYTHVGFHGHYDPKSGHLLPQQVQRYGLKAWIIKYSDGKADPACVGDWYEMKDGGRRRFGRDLGESLQLAADPLW